MRQTGAGRKSNFQEKMEFLQKSRGAKSVPNSIGTYLIPVGAGKDLSPGNSQELKAEITDPAVA
jgi:hypothetical protein